MIERKAMKIKCSKFVNYIRPVADCPQQRSDELNQPSRGDPEVNQQLTQTSA